MGAGRGPRKPDLGGGVDLSLLAWSGIRYGMPSTHPHLRASAHPQLRFSPLNLQLTLPLPPLLPPALPSSPPLLPCP